MMLTGVRAGCQEAWAGCYRGEKRVTKKRGPRRPVLGAPAPRSVSQTLRYLFAVERARPDPAVCAARHAKASENA